MAEATVTCCCGATFTVATASSWALSNQISYFHKAHEACRLRAASGTQTDEEPDNAA